MYSYDKESALAAYNRKPRPFRAGMEKLK